MELFEVWKALAIVLTGAFGILGLATEFRQPRTKKITRWGYASLIGIIVSTIGGVWAQFAEVLSDQKTAAEANRRILAIVGATSKTLTNTQSMMTESNQTTGDIRRLLSPLGSSRVLVSWQVPCSSPAYQPVCEAIAETRVGDAPFTIDKPLSWPVRPHGTLMVVSFKPSKGGPAFLLSGNSGLANPSGPRFRVSGTKDARSIQIDELFFFDPPSGGALKGLYDLVDGEGSVLVSEEPYAAFSLIGIRWIGERNDILVSQTIRVFAPPENRRGRSFLFTLKAER